MTALSHQLATVGLDEVLVEATPATSDSDPVSPSTLAHLADALDIHASVTPRTRGVLVRIRLPVRLPPDARTQAAIATVRAALSFAAISGWRLSAITSSDEQPIVV